MGVLLLSRGIMPAFAHNLYTFMSEYNMVPVEIQLEGGIEEEETPSRCADYLYFTFVGIILLITASTMLVLVALASYIYVQTFII
jgi:hypothetical protein